MCIHLNLMIFTKIIRGFIRAMQAFPRPELSFMGDSGIILAGEENDLLNATNVKHGNSMDASSQGSFETSQEGRAQMAMPWPNHFPQYMQNFQGHGYPPYMFPGMQGQSPYFPGNMQWPVNMGDLESSEKSSKKKKKNKKKKKKSKQAESTEPSDESSAETVSEDGNEGKKSSRKVVIRNINYITSKRNGAKESDSEESEEEEGFVDGDSIKQQVEEAIGSLEKRNKSTSRRRRKHKNHSEDDDSGSKETKGNDNWDAFQNLLLKDKDEEESLQTSSSPLNMESEVVRKREPPMDDSFLVANVNEDWDRESSIKKLDAGENVRLIRRENNYDEEMLNPGRDGESRSYSQAEMSVYDGKLRGRNETEEDWFIRNQADTERDPSLVKTFVGDDFHLTRSSERDVLTDDSFMIHSRVEGQVEESRLRTDIMDSDVYGITQQENHAPEFTQHEPDDLFMVLGREQDVTPTLLPWTPEIDFETNTLAQEKSKTDLETTTKASAGEQTSDGKEKKSRGVSKGKDAKLRGLGRPGPSKAKRPPWGSRAAATKTKSELEEERKKRMEELLIQRQKRIAEKSSNGSVSSSLASKKAPTADKTVKSMTKKEKTPEAAQPKARPVLRSSTIERLAVARTAPKEPQQKPVINRASKPLANKTEKSQDKKSSKVGKSDAKSLELSRDPSLEIKETVEDSESYLPVKQVDEPPPVSSVDDFKDIKELHSLSSEEISRGNNGPNEIIADEKSFANHQKVQDQMKIDDQEIVKKTSACEEKQQITTNDCSEDVGEVKVSPPKPLSPKKSVTFSETNMEEKYYFSPTVSENDISTPPATETDHSRKKWNSEETSPKGTAKVFRKLLMFGKKNRS
uniref:mRNA, clone: RTFL01-12-L14 n=1 Tax=Eutrema halophilum TaxID=98038 RepID=E4MWV1_EUTHA|nr:unnamed protein product [Eutrema halophilum]